MASQVHTTATARTGFSAADIALVAIFAALIAVFTLIPAIFVIGGIPFALQMIIVLLAPLVLGPVRGAAACALYILVGVAGLPVFSGGSSGPAVLVGPTGGYLIGFVVSAFVAGALAKAVLRRRPSRRMLPVLLSACGMLGVVVVHLCGVAFFITWMHMSVGKALLATAPFFPWDLVKAIVAALLAVAVFKSFPALMPPRKA